jgi:hypothetical protein
MSSLDSMGKVVESVSLDDDVGDDLRRLAERYRVTASIERGVATKEILEQLLSAARV